EVAAQPVCVAKVGRELAKPGVDLLAQRRGARLEPGFAATGEERVAVLDDRRLHRAQRSEHPGDGARLVVRLCRQETAVALGNVEEDGAGLEEHEAVLL